MTAPAPPPTQLLSVAELVDARLDRLFAEELARWSSVDPRLAEAVEVLQPVVTGGGKRMRAAFCYWAWHGSESPLRGRTTEETVIDAAAAFELLQAFALIHDDIMDDSDTRRGQPTIHVTQADRLVAQRWLGEPRRYGDGVAILVGDLSHAYADGLVSGVGPAARQVWDELRIELNLGQYLDLRSTAARDLNRATAEQVSMFKSALYTIVRPLQLGASIDGPADPVLLDRLDRYGRPLGRAFQLKDDLLGVLGDEAELGKPVGDDLREGKPTELLAIAVERAVGDQQKRLSLAGQRDLSPANVTAIVDVLVATGAVDEVEKRIAELVDEAIAALDDVALGTDALDALEALAHYVAARTT